MGNVASGLASIFGFGSPQQQPQQNQNTQQQNGQQGNGIVPGTKDIDPSKGPPGPQNNNNQQQNQNNANGNGAPEPKPFDGFEKMWDNTSNPANQPPQLSVDPSKIADAVKDMDFMQHADPSLVQKAMSGDGDAFKQVFNQGLRHVFAMAMQGSTHLVGKHGDSIRGYMESTIPSHVKSAQVQDSFLAENPVFANPAVRPLLGAVEKRLREMYPDASASEITKHARKYLSEVAGMFSEKKGNNQEENPDEAGLLGNSLMSPENRQQQKGTFDWDIWADGKAPRQSFQ